MIEVTGNAARWGESLHLEAAKAAWLQAALLVSGLFALVVARWAATRAGVDALVVGAAFGSCLAALAIVPGGRLRWGRGIRTATLGLAFGLALVLLAAAAPVLSGAPHIPGLGRPAVDFVPWALITTLVATAEEAVLRGVLFDRLRRSGGAVGALAVTTALFALMHVPVYGWHVVPLDLAVGLGLGGLRLVTRGIGAPAIAHTVADLATWWL